MHPRRFPPLLLLLLAASALATATTTTAAATADDTLYTALLRDHVRGVEVDYRALARDPRLDTYLASLDATDPASLPSRDAQLALWINAYNAYTLKLITTVHPVDSIRRITDLGRTGSTEEGRPWDIAFARVGGRAYTLEHIEHRIIRPSFRDPRIHFALVCAAVSCPPLRPEAYTGAALESQLAEQTRWFLIHRNTFDSLRREAGLSALFDWYAGDFGGTPAALLDFIADYAPAPVATDLRRHPDRWRIRYLDYDWRLNDRR